MALPKEKEVDFVQIQVIKPNKEQVKKLRVCAYCRVSTEAEDQENSLENQKTHYEELIRNNSTYEYVRIYYDFGVSGYKENRPAFQEMMKDVRDGKIDLILTKSVSRFARNTVTFLKAVRELKELGVGIFFELQNINTLDESGELLMTILSAFAQAESDNYSELSKMGIRRKFEKGEPIQHLERCYGYTIDEDGTYLIELEEAKWVKTMYQMIADGYTAAEVKRFLNERGVKTKKGVEFCDSTVFRIIESEIYKGDYMMHKQYVNADRKEVKNRGEVDAWYITDNHPAIVSHKLWQKAQDAIAKKREYLATGSIVGDNNTETYPYKNKIFCAKCGYPLMFRKYSNGNRVCWCCSGQKRFNKGFCEGINIPDSVIRDWGDIDEDIYIRECIDAKGKRKFKYISKVTWKRSNKKKSVPEVVALNEMNYPYLKHIFCKECGSRLVRYDDHKTEIRWICNGSKRKGTSFCKGVRVPDSIIKSWNLGEKDYYIERVSNQDGEECYSYSSKTGTSKAE